MQESTIRPAQIGDLARLVELCALHAEFEKAPYSSCNKKEMLSKELFNHSPALHCLVVEQNRTIVGYTTYMKQYSTWEAAFYLYMDCLFLIKEARGFGIGERLVEDLKMEALRLGCKQLQWQTPDFNERAMKFYQRIGGLSKPKERYFLEIEN